MNSPQEIDRTADRHPRWKGSFNAFGSDTHSARLSVAVRCAGLNPHQHQLMLALKGLPPNLRPSIRELAARLQIRHHSTVELVNRLARSGHVRRQRGAEDRREVVISLTVKGEKVLSELSLHHRTELRKAGPALIGALWAVIRGTKNVGC